MSDEKPTYAKLPGSGRRESSLFVRGGGVSLWLGGDHLLSVENEGYRESYKRFYLKDIQGITIRRTVEGQIINFLLTAPMMLFGSIAIFSKDAGMAGGFGFMASIFLFFLIVNIFRGPTCQAMLFTAVQAERLVTLHRLKTAKKVLARLYPLITAAQGELKLEEMGPGTPAGQSSAPSPLGMMTKPEAPYLGKTHQVLAWVALADLIGTTVVTAIGPELSRVYSLLHMAALIIIAIIALNKQKDTTLPAGLKRLPVVLIAAVVGTFFLSMIFGVYFSITQPHTVESMRENPFGSPWQVAMTVISTGINGLGGLYGVVKFRQYRQSLPVPPPPPSDPPPPPLTPDLPV